MAGSARSRGRWPDRGATPPRAGARRPRAPGRRRRRCSTHHGRCAAADPSGAASPASTRAIRSRPWLITHTAPAATARPRGRKPTFCAVPVTRPVAGVATGAVGAERAGFAGRASAVALAVALAARERQRRDDRRGDGGRRGRRADHRPPAARRSRRRRVRRRLPHDRRPHIAPERARRRLALGRILGERAQDHRVDRRGELRTAGPTAWAARRRAAPRAARFVGRPLERHVPGEHEEDDRAERVDVCPRVDRLAADLLGCREVDRAHPPARLGVRGRAEQLARCRSRSGRRDRVPRSGRSQA